MVFELRPLAVGSKCCLVVGLFLKIRLLVCNVVLMKCVMLYEDLVTQARHSTTLTGRHIAFDYYRLSFVFRFYSTFRFEWIRTSLLFLFFIESAFRLLSNGVFTSFVNFDSRYNFYRLSDVIRSGESLWGRSVDC